MKTKQKIVLGFSFLAFGLIFAVGSPQKAFAAEVNEASFKNTLYRITAFENNRPKSISVNIAGRQFTFVDSNTNDDDINLKSTNNNFFICAQSSRTTGITITGRATPVPNGGESRAGFITLSYKDDTGEKCDGNADEFLNRLSISAVSGLPAPPGTEEPAEEATTEDECNASFWSFSWAFCPIIGAIDGMFDGLNGFIEDQLSYDIKKYFTADTKRTWSVIRTIATSVLVIIMLVMVFSQAINAGLFDAYTVRKLLPRLVVAAILIQVSYDLFIWVISLANNAGRGVYDLLAVPFGGHEALGLDQIIGKLGGGAAAATTLIPAMLGAGIVIFNPFGVLLFGFAVLLAVLVAAATLLIRNVLILACVILVPLALVAWILPGTNRYWKLWWDNFIKLLLLFPIIMAIIVVGRIFAHTVASTDSGPFVWLAVLVGFFGPYFLLPRAFKWGGSIMAEAGNKISGAGESFGKRPREFLKGRQEGYQAEKLRKSGLRVAKREYFTGNPASWFRAPMDKMRSGQWDPTLGTPGSQRRKRTLASYKAKARSSEEEDVNASKSSMQIDLESLDETIKGRRVLAAESGHKLSDDDAEFEKQYKALIQEGKITGNDKDDLVRAVALGNSDHKFVTVDGRVHTLGNISQEDQRASWDTLLRLGGAGNMRVLNEALGGVDEIRDDKQRSAALLHRNKFYNDNVGALFNKMPHRYKGVDGAIASMSPEALTQMDGVGMEVLVGDLTTRLKNNPGDANAAKSLKSLVSTFHEAANSELRGRIPPGVATIMKTLVDGKEDGDEAMNASLGLAKGKLVGRPRLENTSSAKNIIIEGDPLIASSLEDLSKQITAEGRVLPVRSPTGATDAVSEGVGGTSGAGTISRPAAPEAGGVSAIPSEGVSLHGRQMGGVSTGGGTTIISPTGGAPGGGVSTPDIKKAFGEALRENADVFKGGSETPPAAPRGFDVDPETGTPKPPEDDKS